MLLRNHSQKDLPRTRKGQKEKKHLYDYEKEGRNRKDSSRDEKGKTGDIKGDADSNIKELTKTNF